MLHATVGSGVEEANVGKFVGAVVGGVVTVVGDSVGGGVGVMQ